MPGFAAAKFVVSLGSEITSKRHGFSGLHTMHPLPLGDHKHRV
jgi:hypothetical protein